ncbi:MAG TPA: sugar phosphate isomerase/epimerase [Tepidisphaeraceae bacterium]|jgi:sugar phosphate isomerase/epimerase|nr:sugar phosphate isomerase/epimerase [Tepidisphaeraceae bacterium]
MPYPLSIQMYTVRDLTKTPEDRVKVIREIGQIGYVATEGGGGKLTDDTRQLYRESGLKFSSWWAVPTADNVQQFIDIAKETGITHFIGSDGPDKFKDESSIKALAERYETAAQLLKPHGLQQLYHNHYWEFDIKHDGRYAWDVFFDQAPTLGAELDLYWASNFGAVDVPAVLRKYASRTPIVHVKDGPLVKDQPNTAVGKGKFDNKAAIAAADPNVLKWLVVELDNYVEGNDKMMDAVRDSYAYLTNAGLATGQR